MLNCTKNVKLWNPKYLCKRLDILDVECHLFQCDMLYMYVPQSLYVACVGLHIYTQRKMYFCTPPKKDIPFPFKNLNQVVHHIREQILSYGK